MPKNKIILSIKGRTFDEIRDDDLTVSYGTLPNNYNKVELIKAILNKININMLTIGKSENSNRLNLFNDFNGKAYYDGIAGVLKKTNIAIKDDEVNNQTFDVKLQITTKFDDEKPYFLATMLLYDKIALNDNTVPSNEDEIFDYLLLYRFKELLQKACLKGLYKTYRRFECNDERLRGSIDIARHIKLNAGQNNGKIAYSYRERTTNNYLNYLIVAAYMHLKDKYYDLVVDTIDSNFDLLSVINQLKNDTGYIKGGLKSIISKNLKAITHPLYTEYEELRVISIKILRDEGLSIFDGEDEDTNGILFYVPDLWESFLESRMYKYVDCLKNKEIALKPQAELSVLSKAKNSYFFKTRPDYVFFDSQGKPFLILDAKFKPAWENSIKEDTRLDSNLLNDYSKCLRDMVDFSAKSTGIIFPCCTESYQDFPFDCSAIKHYVSDYNTVNCFYTIPVQVPSAKDFSYSIWKSKFDECVKNDISKLDKILKSLSTSI